MTPHLNIASAFLAGLASFLSPCVLPLVPSYLSFLTGTTLEDLKGIDTAAERGRVLAHALAFISGFTLIFVLIGLSASAIGNVFGAHKDAIARIGGIIVIVLGLNMMGVFKIPQLMMDKRVHAGSVLKGRKQSFWLSFLVGIGFAAGWSPCIGPILSAIILLAAQEQVGQATLLLLVYSLGLAVPFLITAAAITQSLGALNKIKRFLPMIEATAGAILVATGLVLVTNSFTRIAGIFISMQAAEHLAARLRRFGSRSSPSSFSIRPAKRSYCGPSRPERAACSSPTSWPGRSFKTTPARSDCSERSRSFLIAMALAVLVFFWYSYRDLAARSMLVRIAFGAIVGGAVGNIIDRIRHGFVVDFIDMSWNPLFNVFNVADASITIGVVLLLIKTFERDRARAAQPGAGN